MGIFVFVGPTMGVEEARNILDATYLPPASQGDVFRLVATSDARVIGIIDGHFNEVPSVWHKELLWAMSQGVHVLGAGSIGALRAAELEAFGMVGEGRIFEAYRSGVLEPYSTRRSRTMMRSRWFTRQPSSVIACCRTHLSTFVVLWTLRRGRNNLACTPGSPGGIGKVLFLRRAQLRSPHRMRLAHWMARAGTATSARLAAFRTH